VDAIERRSAGLLDEGRTFFASFRSLRDVKIAGTYNFDLMLEVPSRLEDRPSTLSNSPWSL